MAKTEMEIIRISLERSDTGLYSATSPDLPGICVTHRDPEAIYSDMPNIVRLWYKSNRDKDVRVMQEPLPKSNDGLDWESVAFPAEIAAMQATQ